MGCFGVVFFLFLLVAGVAYAFLRGDKGTSK